MNGENTHNEVWDSCLKIIKDNIANDAIYDTWFKPITASQLDGSVLTITVPSPYFYEYLEHNFIDLLKFSLQRVLGKDAKLEYNVQVTEQQTVKYPTNSKPAVKNPPVPFPKQTNEAMNPFVIPGLKQLEIDPQLNPDMSFDNFVESDCNRMGRSAGLAVADKPGKTPFNPMFIYGGSGLGKTHLAQAIGLETKRLHPEKIVLYVSANLFQTQYVDAQINKNKINDFLNFYQMIDVLIIDDIQEFAGKEGTQNTFFHIFNHLHQSGKQLILTSDRTPIELQGLEERLLSRFKWGLTVELQAPDFAARKAILMKKIHNEGIEISEDVVDFIANKITTNIRELEGALISLLAQSTLNKKEITIELAQQTTERLVNSNKREVSINKIKTTVCSYFGIPIDSLQSKTRKREIVQARQIAMFLCRNMTKHALATIGAEIGGKDHATVLYACKTVEDLSSTDKLFSQHLNEIEKRINTTL